MNVVANAPSSAKLSSNMVRDDIASMQAKSWDELFAMEKEEVELFQLGAARRRFEELAPKVKALKTKANDNKITTIKTLDEIPSLLFDHSAYKSYPMSLLEQTRFDLMTRWLGGMTSIDLSGVDASKCGSIDQWFDVLQRETPLRIYHTTGTSGKLSFIPRTVMERDLWNEGYLKVFEGFGASPGITIGGKHGVRMPIVVPGTRYGNYTAHHVLDFLAREVAPSEADVHVSSQERLSADIVSLSGRVRIAQAKGELGQMKLNDTLRMALKKYLDGIEQRGQEMADFFARIIEELQGRQVFMNVQASYLVQAANKAAARGMSHIFAANSAGTTGGGDKDAGLPADWRRVIADFSGFDSGWRISYAMSEVTATMPRCSADRYHVPPYAIPYLIDQGSGSILPREGTQTGRFAVLDLLPQTYWGGVISGDKVTLEWDRQCKCGRRGVYAHVDISRYAQAVTGDDKITCSATVDNSDVSLQQLLAG